MYGQIEGKNCIGILVVYRMLKITNNSLPRRFSCALKLCQNLPVHGDGNVVATDGSDPHPFYRIELILYKSPPSLNQFVGGVQWGFSCR